ncbi:hypothetical protein D3C71_631020 [compost metagenome]
MAIHRQIVVRPGEVAVAIAHLGHEGWIERPRHTCIRGRTRHLGGARLGEDAAAGQYIQATTGRGCQQQYVLGVILHAQAVEGDVALCGNRAEPRRIEPVLQ